MKKTIHHSVHILLLVFLIEGQISAQNNIQGLVVSDSEESIAYANVILLVCQIPSLSRELYQIKKVYFPCLYPRKAGTTAR
jgi:hypothetical protein